MYVCVCDVCVHHHGINIHVNQSRFTTYVEDFSASKAI